MPNQEISTRYNPKEVEEKWYNFWLQNGFFHAEPSKGGKPFTIVIPPPNITGILHMGHALNNTIQDILIRWKRMQGYNTLWLPGTDHAGIATQNVVERKLEAEGKSRKQLGRERFLEEVWQWRQQYGNTIINQLKRMGCSCDWERTRFTMDEGLSNAVKEVFLRLYKKGLIYQGDYIINWCPRCQTALSDEESEHEELKGFLYYIRYPLKGGGYVTVATTRPETMLGDTAVAVNPQDKRYKYIHGKTVILPILEREIPVIQDEYVDIKFGTGVVKITPGHDPNDFLIGQRHKLPIINVMNDDGTMNENAGPYISLDRFECREALLVDLKERGLLEKTESHTLSVGHCYRCHTIIEPRVSRQWFVRMKPLAEKAIEVVENGQIKFVPSRWTKVYLNWMYNIKDWCISRQIWWGHKIPIDGEEDVLDTWFSSWLWPFSTMGWPQDTPELRFYYPTDVLVTAQEIIFFWVARMIMAGLEFTGKPPFHTVYIHGTVRDETGRKMSKSIGNIIDPIEIIDEYGADALRFSIISITSQGQDVFLARHRFETGRNFTNKIWNAYRFVQGLTLNTCCSRLNLEQPAESDLTLEGDDDWFIVGRLQETIRDVTKNLEKFRFKEASQLIYDFFWHDFCDKYIEVVKGQGKQAILRYVLQTSMQILHPFMPFITEEIWQRLGNKGSIMISQWPVFNKKYYKKEIVKRVEEKFELINKGRALRSEYNIEPSKKLDFYIKPHIDGLDPTSIAKLLGAENLIIDKKFKPPYPMPSVVTSAGTIYMSLKGIDVEKERARLEKALQEIERELDFVTKKLKNKQFLSKAPKEVVEKERQKKKELLEKKKKIRALEVFYNT